MLSEQASPHKTPLGIVYLTPAQAAAYREQPCVPVTLAPPKQITPKRI
jgi:hypothetical protein